MAKTLALFLLALAFCFISGAHAARITFKNNCGTTVWPGTLAGDKKNQLSKTGFELTSQAFSSIDVQAPWSGRVWARTRCSTNAGRFTCETAGCHTGDVACNGNGPQPPVTLVEITIAPNGGEDYYDVSLVDGFNLPISVATESGTGYCKPSSCTAHVSAACPVELQVTASDGSVIACNSACTKFGLPQYCCTGPYNKPETCPPSEYSMIFKNQCPLAYSYAYDDKSSTFTCFNAPNYVITFCPSIYEEELMCSCFL